MTSSVYFAEHDILGTNNGYNIGNHMPARHFIQRRKVGKTGRADFQAVWHIGAVRNQINAEFAFRVLDCRISFARRYVKAFGEKLEMMNQLFHILLHFNSRGRRYLVVIGYYRAGILPQPVDTLFDDAVGLTEFLDPDQVAIVAIPVHTYG